MTKARVHLPRSRKMFVTRPVERSAEVDVATTRGVQGCEMRGAGMEMAGVRGEGGGGCYRVLY